jgi:hypothetical protein
MMFDVDGVVLNGLNDLVYYYKDDRCLDDNFKV